MLFFSVGIFTCIYADIKFQRQFEFYLIQTYIPTILIVMLSWVSFWIDMYAVPARITLGLLTVLTMTTQSASTMERLPRVSYIKAIDLWQSVCLVFVFGSLIEYSVVNVLSRRYKKKTEQPEQRPFLTAEDLEGIVVENNTSTPPPDYQGSQQKQVSAMISWVALKEVGRDSRRKFGLAWLKICGEWPTFTWYGCSSGWLQFACMIVSQVHMTMVTNSGNQQRQPVTKLCRQPEQQISDNYPLRRAPEQSQRRHQRSQQQQSRQWRRQTARQSSSQLSLHWLSLARHDAAARGIATQDVVGESPHKQSHDGGRCLTGTLSCPLRYI